jgi:hypothetical protein
MLEEADAAAVQLLLCRFDSMGFAGEGQRGGVPLWAGGASLVQDLHMGG